MAMADVTVMGAGIFGLSVAYACARRGARVRVIERRRIGAGASGGPVGALAPHVPEAWNAKKAFQLEALLMAQDHWREVAERSGLPTGYARTGRLQPLADAHAVALARQRADSARELWQGCADWQVVTADAVGDWRLRSATGLYVYDSLTARIDPLGACLSLAWAARSLGAAVQCGTEADLGTGVVVWATGWEGLAALAQPPARPAGAGVKGQALAVRYDARHRPQLFADGLHIVPHANGTVAIGSTTERDFSDGEAVDGGVEDLRRRAVELCPDLRGADVVWRWAGIRPRARSRAPMLGPWPGRPAHFVANGAFKIGFGLGPKVGEVMAELVLEGRNTVPAGLRVEDSL